MRRLKKTIHLKNGTSLPIRTVAIIPLGLDVDYRRVAKHLRKELSSHGQRAILLDCMSAERSTRWFHAAEARNDITLYCAEPANEQWTNLCLRIAETQSRLTRLLDTNCRSSCGTGTSRGWAFRRILTEANPNWRGWPYRNRFVVFWSFCLTV